MRKFIMLNSFLPIERKNRDAKDRPVPDILVGREVFHRSITLYHIINQQR